MHKTTIESKPEDENYHKYGNSTELPKKCIIYKKKKQNMTWKIFQSSKSQNQEPELVSCKPCLHEALTKI